MPQQSSSPQDVNRPGLTQKSEEQILFDLLLWCEAARFENHLTFFQVIPFPNTIVWRSPDTQKVSDCTWPASFFKVCDPT